MGVAETQQHAENTPLPEVLNDDEMSQVQALAPPVTAADQLQHKIQQGAEQYNQLCVQEVALVQQLEETRKRRAAIAEQLNGWRGALDLVRGESA